MGEPPSTKPLRDSGESKELLRTSSAARQIERRLFLKQGLSVGALTLLTGCDVTDTSAVQSVLDGISRWNDRAQAAIFNSRRLMATYPESQAVKDFRYNAYFGQNQIPKIDGASYKLNLSGLVDRRAAWTLQDLYQLPQESQVTRHVCVEGIDPVYFGVLFIVNNSIGLITPPVGVVLNVVAGVARIPMAHLIRAVWPFMWAELVVLLLMVLFPALVTVPAKWIGG